MTVSTQVSRNEYTGNGATTQYDFTFRILDKSHLLVQTLDTSESIVTLTLGTDYTVTGVNRYNGGKVVLTSALPAGYKISIERSTPVTQEASIRNQGGFFPEIHEDAFDKLTMLVQQAYGWWSGLSLRKPSWLANYYDALGNQIRNLKDPVNQQDAATKNYVDNSVTDSIEYSEDLFSRTLRVPESSVPMYANSDLRSNMLVGCNNVGSFVPIAAQTDTADLAIKLAGTSGAMLIGGLPSVTASSYGFTGSGNESSLAKLFLDYCIDNNKQAVVDMDVNWDGLVYTRGGLNLTGEGKVQGFVIIKGDTLKTRTNSVTLGTANDYTTYSAGTTTFPGNFSAYSVGDKIAIELAADTGFNGSINQIGVHFSTVVSASSSQLVIADGLRFAFDKFTISKTSFVKYTGSLAVGTTTITGDFSSFSAGDVVRFENITGTDSVNAGTVYFEYSRIKNVSVFGIVLVDPLATAFGDPFIVPAAFLNKLNILNANFDVLQLRAITGPQVKGCRFNRSINDYSYAGNFSDSIVTAATPNAINFTYARRMTIDNIVTSGATGTTDNAAFKMMSPIECTVDGVVATDYGISSGSQSINGFYVDFLFTPYYNWGRNVQMSNINTGKDRGGLGIWLDGIKGGSLKSSHGGADSRLYELVNFDAELNCDFGVFIRNPIRAKMKVDSNFVQVTGPQFLDLYPTVRKADDKNAGRCISIGGSSTGPWTVPVGNDVRIIDGVNYSTIATDTTLYFQNINNLEVVNLKDLSGLAYSINTSTANVSGRICIGPHDLKNAINTGSYSGPHKIESDLAIGTKAATPPAYDRRRIQWGQDWLFKSSIGILYKPGSEPASATDGYILSMKVPVPATATSGGQAGQWASDGTYLYICTATNTWRRAAVSAW